VPLIQTEWYLSYIALVMGFLLAVILAVDILRKRRAPTATIAWLLFIITLPHLGVPAYLLLGGRKMRRIARSKQGPRLIDEQGGRAMTRSPAERILISHGLPAASAGNRIRLHVTGTGTYKALRTLIDEAHESIYLTFFMLRPDRVGLDILERLERRAAAGVRVRLLLDGVGSLRTHRRYLQPLQQAGGRYAYFMPVLHHPLRGRTNLRNHRKLVIVDEHSVLAGGANIAIEYMGPESRPDRWRDLTFTLAGPSVSDCLEVFRSDWAFASGEWLPGDTGPGRPRSPGETVAQVVPSGPDMEGDTLYDALLEAVFNARERLWIMTPYYIPDPALNRALCLAARRGVDVRVLLPENSNHWLADVTGRSYLRELLLAGGKVFRYRPGMLHAKAVLLDQDMAMLGSANFDMRSLLLNYELAVLVYSGTVILELETWMSALMREASRGLRPIGLAGEIGEGLARLFSPQL